MFLQGASVCVYVSLFYSLFRWNDGQEVLGGGWQMRAMGRDGAGEASLIPTATARAHEARRHVSTGVTA